MKNKKILKKGLLLTLGLGASAIAITAIAASCNNKNNGEAAKQSNKGNNGEAAKQSNKDKAAKYMENKLNEILSKLSSSNESVKQVLEPTIKQLRSQFAKQIDDTLKASGKADMTDEEYNAFVNAFDASLKNIPSL